MKSKILEFLNRYISWDSLRVLPANKIIASSYVWIVIVPVVAKIFSKVQESIAIGLNGYEFELVLSLPFSWKLFFFSALFFTAGNIIFLMCCPEAIRKYVNYDDFMVNGGDISDLSRWKKDISFQKKVEFELLRENLKQKPNLKEIFWFTYKNVKEINVLYRTIISIFYMVGLTLFSIVAVSNVWWVINSGYVF